MDLLSIFEVMNVNSPRKKAARLRALQPSIDVARSEGYTHLEIVEFLNAQGFEITYGHYRSILHKNRARTSPVPTVELPQTDKPEIKWRGATFVRDLVKRSREMFVKRMKDS